MTTQNAAVLPARRTVFADIVRGRIGDDRPGVLFEGRVLTWGEIVQGAADRAAALADLSWPTGRPLHVGVLLENIPDYVQWVCAAALCGATVVGINATRRGAELAHDVRHTDCDLLITENRLAGLVDGLDLGIPAERIHNVDTPGYAAWLARYSGSPMPMGEIDPAANLLLLFSSGSTGVPKAVICTHARLAAVSEAMLDRCELTRDSVAYLAMPLFHGNALMLNLGPAMVCGATIAVVRKFSASGFVRDVHEHGVTFFNYVGRALAYVLAQPSDPRDATSTLRRAVGTEASAVDISRFTERFDVVVSEGYGSSEGVMRINRTPDTPGDALGVAVGGSVVKVLDEVTGLECPPGRLDGNGRLVNAEEAIGQLVGIGMAARFEGYYKNPEATAERVRGDDFWSGDLAYRDAGGYFYFAGRSSDWLRVDSENFAAGPVERILERWEPVAVAPVFAVPDPRTGDQVMCALQLRDGFRFDPDAFTAFLAAQTDLGPKWRPRFVRIVEEVPTTGNNKIAKQVLRRAAWVTTDPVFVRDGASTTYRRLTPADVEEFENQFTTHGRAALLPVTC
ncbi:AMP-binding protein [Amycolatopsis rhizosphaerae]|uniref:AMP-binding protein n=1 Tax=Amycolatopsis rhizosphaerae TaxID=2053003 RepID=A0A558DJX2_9PSEU|nr:AMP-binding protein [Amycolatopsis rhizosphaerae]TVT61315.1 AMP-binding protein [Amycolatopsis rhizosphaerae]